MRSLCDHLLRLKPVYQQGRQQTPAISDDDTAATSSCLRSLPPDLGLRLLTWCVEGGDRGHRQRTTASSLVASSLDGEAESDHWEFESGRVLAEACLVRFSVAALDIDRVRNFGFSLNNGIA